MVQDQILLRYFEWNLRGNYESVDYPAYTLRVSEGLKIRSFYYVVSLIDRNPDSPGSDRLPPTEE